MRGHSKGKPVNEADDITGYEGPDPFPRWPRRPPEPYRPTDRIAITATGRLAIGAPLDPDGSQKRSE